MGAKGSKGTFNRQAESRQSQKKTYQKFRQSMTKLTKEVNKVKIQNKEKLLELEIAIKSAANYLEIARTYTEPAFEEMFEDFLKTCEELDQVVKGKLEQNDKNLEEIQQQHEGPNNPQNSDLIETEQINISIIQNIENNGPLNNETALFAEDFPEKKQKKIKLKKKTDKLEQNKINKSKNKNKADILEVNSIISEEADRNTQVPDSKKDSKKDKHKKNKNNNKEVDDNIARDTLDVDEIDHGGTTTLKKRFWSFPMRLKRKPSAITSNPDTQQPIILIQDPENEDRSLQNIEIQQIEKAIKNNNKKDKSKRQSRAQSQFFDQQSDVPPTPSSTPVPSPKLEPPIQQQDPLQEIHNIRMSIGTLEEMTKIYRFTKRGNYDYIYDNLYLCVNKLKDMDQDQNFGVLTLRHENKLAMQQAQNCLNVLEGKIEVPERVDSRMSQQSDQRSSGGVPQVVIARTPSKKRENYQKSVEFIDITNNEEIIDVSMKTNREIQNIEEIAGESTVREKLNKLENITHESTDEFSEEDDLKDILMNLEDSVEEINHQTAAPNKPILITSF